MSAYLVRLEANKELVGLFVIPATGDLWWAVDECCDPYACEFIAVKYGGIIWDSQGTPIYDDDDESVNLDGSQFTESLAMLISEAHKRKWKQLDVYAPKKTISKKKGNLHAIRE
jgi:hypothetical protein